MYTKYALESISEYLSLTTSSHLRNTIISCPCAILPSRHWEDCFVGRQRHSPLYLVNQRNLMIFEVSYLRQHWSVRFQLSIYLCVASEKAILVSKPGSRGIGINTTWFLNNKSRRDRDSRIRAFWDDMTLSYLLFCRAELDEGERNVFLYPCYESDKVTHAVISHSRWKTLPCTEIYSGLFGVKGR